MILLRGLAVCWFSIVLLLMAGCSSTGSGPISTTYHNTTARYNAYFIANTRLQETEAALAASHERNFNDLLYIFPPIDTAVASGLKTELEDVMKKSSLIIERHENSKWVDDAYLLIGKSRFYGREFEKAVQTFKFINTNFEEEEETRHTALLFLSRTFMDMGELANAKAALDYIRKERPEGDNLLLYHLTAAHLYRLREDWNAMAAHLAEAAPMASNEQGQPKIYYMLGQLYQELNRPALAYEAYHEVIKSNPDYTLGFYARLNMAQVVNLGEEKDAEEIRHYFAKLLRDKKNVEYRDKIYYEQARFELRQDNETAAVRNLKQSIEASIENTYQKALSYRLLGELAYDDARYAEAEAWYDSTLQFLPQTDADYTSLQTRYTILSDLVRETETIYLQDSLLTLSELDSLELYALADARIEEERRQEEAVKARNLTQANVRTGFNTVRDDFGLSGNPGPNTSGQWYFNNPNAIAVGRSEFIKRWGNRPLEDFWRVSDRGRENTTVTTAAQAQEEFEDNAAIDPTQEINMRRQELIATVPRTPQQRIEANKKIEEAYFNLGRIYFDQLKENLLAIEAFESLLGRYPESEHNPEALYTLYLLYQKTDQQKANQYRDQLIAQYPNSTFAQVAKNPNYLAENDRLIDSLQQVYEQAYKYYTRNAFAKADSLLSPALRRHPETSQSDRIYLLHTLVVGEMEGKAPYEYRLSQFAERYPESALQGYAAELLSISQGFSESQAKRQGTKFIADFEQPHYFLLVYKINKKLANELISAIDSFNLQNFKPLDLKATNLILDDDRAMVFVSQFSGPEPAMEYYRSIRNDKPWAGIENVRAQYFVISRDNFQLLYDAKDPDSYQKFFDKSYTK